jgi:hypothetical protein
LTESNTGLGERLEEDNGPPKQEGIAILISEKVYFKHTLIKQDKGHFILIKGEIHQKEVPIINLYELSSSNFF